MYVKHVRIKERPTKPIALKPHQSVIKKNPKDYKQQYYVVNDENYLIALYRGKKGNGSAVSDYFVSNLLDSIKNKQAGKELYPLELTKKGAKLKLYKVLKNGKTVIFQNSENENILELSKKELFSRIYRVSGIENDGRVSFTHLLVQKAKDKENKNDLLDEKIPKYKRVFHSAVYCLVEGTDFTVSPTGEIIKKGK